MKYIILEEKKKIAIGYTTSNIEQIVNIHSTYNVGDIYIGVVESILENLDIAFIKLDEWRENGFMVLKNEFFFYAERKY